jgi:myo-inositol-1(or 4)-monophosphatase
VYREPKSVLAALERAGRAGAELAMDMFRGARLDPRRKWDGSPVTLADVEVEKLIKADLEARFPDLPIVGEETSDDLEVDGGEYIAVDPIDGTSNYLRGTPFFAVTLAYLQDGWPLAGVVIDPVHKVTYSAVRGGGAERNGEPLALSEEKPRSLRRATVSLPGESLPRRLQERFLGRIAARLHRMQSLRAVALELAGLAAGWIDATVFGSISVWDVAAGCLIVEEAGGVWTAIDGMKIPFSDSHGRYSILAACSLELHSEIRSLIDGPI